MAIRQIITESPNAKESAKHRYQSGKNNDKIDNSYKFCKDYNNEETDSSKESKISYK